MTLYILAAALSISIGLCIWVGWCFKNDRFPYIWWVAAMHVPLLHYRITTHVSCVSFSRRLMVCKSTAFAVGCGLVCAAARQEPPQTELPCFL